MPRHLPTAALVLGIAGLIPFIACGIAALSTFDDARAMFFLQALVAYGAVILAFLGGVHWGFVLEAPETGARIARRQDAPRLVFGVLPSLVGWVALGATLAGLPPVALAILIAGFVAVTATEAQLHRRGLMPSGYMWLRWGLSIVVALVLATVLTLRLIGARISF